MNENRSYYGESDEKNIDPMRELASVLSEMGRFLDVLDLKKEIADIYRKKYGDIDEKTIDAVQDLALELDTLKKYDEELDIQKDLFDHVKSVNGEANEMTLSCMADIAETLDKLGRSEEALEIQRDIFTLKEKNCDSDNELYYIMYDFSKLLCNHCLYEEALSILQKMLELKQKNYEDDYEEIIEVKRSIAYMLTILKRYKEAFDVWAEIKTNLAHNYGLIHAATLSAEYNMLYLLCARKEYDEAVKFQEKTTALFQNNEEYKKIPLITLYGSAICFLLRTGMKYNSIFESNPCESILSLFGQSKKKVTSDIYSKKSYRLHPEELIDKIVLLTRLPVTRLLRLVVANRLSSVSSSID